VTDHIDAFRALPPHGREVSEDEVRRWREAREAERWRQVRQKIGVPHTCRDASFQGLWKTDAAGAVRRFMVGPYYEGKSLWLMGGNGLGKTWAAAAAVRESGRDNNHEVGRRFIDFTTLCSDLQSSSWEFAEETLRQAKETWFVVFDEFGREDSIAYIKAGGPLEVKIESIIRAREEFRRPTIFTTNMTKADIKAAFSERVLSRLSGDWADIENCDGEDLRKKETQ
jgi:DNA replication protein DnaC